MKEGLKTKDLRNFIRFLTVILLVPWFGWITENIFGLEVEFEVEMVTFISFIVFGSFWCGWLCPFGNLSYFMEKIGRSLFPSVQVTFDGKLDKILRSIKYILLAGFIYLIISHGHNYFFGSHMEIYKSSTLSFMFLKMKKYMIILVPLLIPRFFCKYICPQKAMYNILHRFIPSLVIERDADKCVSCGRCDKVCSMNINISKEKKICGNDCISCFNCIDEKVCPKGIGALKLKYINKNVNVNKFSLVVLAVYFVATYITMQILN